MDFCAPIDLTIDINTIQGCVSFDAEATCGGDCAWRHGTGTTVPTTPTGPAPLFTKPFCHPVNVDKDTKDSVWEGCLTAGEDVAKCSITPGCVYSDGKELIPEKDFCAPMDLTNDVTLI
jgi:hypothetical protein